MIASQRSSVTSRGFSTDDVLSRFRGGERRLQMRAARRADAHDIDIVALDELLVVLVPWDLV